MTTKKAARKPKTFWAVRIAKAKDETDTMNVTVFPRKPQGEMYEQWGGRWEWESLDESDGGQICYAHFLRVTGIKLEVGKPVEIAITARIV